ncbi:CvpA family protein [Mariniblastus fucicola]|uniref:Colicin V production protein n=1 Tax=Mariniblastus fucicola TaxID=980251 RepID=A0A5B9PEU9_9BACT|nr:CvpA family protein [Mariniblastus fucicola]QEG25267.1 Colicin V production protein [Mariniblastus fucicola]
MIIAFVIILFLLVVASTWWYGMWSNFITLINFFIASLIASSFYEPLAHELANSMRQYSALADFIALWILFVGVFILCRTITDTLSPRQMKFDIVTEMIGRSVFSIWIACVFIAFTLFSFHMAPLHPDAFQKEVESSTLGIGPDRMWLAFIQSRSRGALSASTEKNFMVRKYNGSTHPDDAGLDVRVFDPNAKFIDKYHEKRAKLAEKDGFRE